MSSARFCTRRLALVAIPALCFTAACATSSSSNAKLATSNEPQQRFRMVGNGWETTAVISPGGAQGPNINVGRFDNGAAIRGTINNQPFQLAVDQAAGTANGQTGWGPLSMNATEEGDALKCNGLIGRPGTITISQQSLNGTVGVCSYEMTRQGDSYTGSRSCGRGISNATVTFPTNILEWKPINICVLMALLMSTP
jgi:hypothetical protein